MKTLCTLVRRMKLVSWTPESGTDDTQPQTFCKGEAVFVRLNKLRHQVSFNIVFDGYSLALPLQYRRYSADPGSRLTVPFSDAHRD